MWKRTSSGGKREASRAGPHNPNHPSLSWTDYRKRYPESIKANREIESTRGVWMMPNFSSYSTTPEEQLTAFFHCRFQEQE